MFAKKLLIPIMVFAVSPAFAANCEVSLIQTTDASTTGITNCINGELYQFGSNVFESCLDCKPGVSSIETTYISSSCGQSTSRTICAAACTSEFDAETTMDGCGVAEIYNFGGGSYTTCKQCLSGYKAETRTYTYSQTCTNSETYIVCVVDPNAECTDDSDCPDVLEAPDSTGRALARMGGYCSGGECAYQDEYYGCVAGYYGSGDTCTKCPASADGATVTTFFETTPTLSWTTDVRGCFIAKDTTGTDTAGSFIYENKCSYSE